MRLVFATNNTHKLEEISKAVNSDIEIISLKDINCHDDIPEEQDTLEGNALQKARYIKEKYDCNCFADDTGLEIEALGGRPGVYSARYASGSRDADANMNKVLEEMVNETNRKACFRTIIALIIDEQEYLFEGRVDGEILKERQGEEGFGYDPIFKAKNFNISFAQMSIEEKNAISHRGLATQKLISFLKARRS